MKDTVVKALKDIVGQNNASSDLIERLAYQDAHLPSGELIRGIPDAVVMPETAEQVSQIVALANKERIPVIPRGCGECQSGANIAQKGGILLDMALLNKILEINQEDMVVVAEGGCSTYRIMWELNKLGLRLPWGPVFTCGPLIGSAVATNATGDFMRYGRLGDNIVGLEVVLPNGDIVVLGSGAYASGYGHYHRYVGTSDLTGIFVNSGGAMGIITKVAVRLLAKPGAVSYLTYGWRRDQSKELTIAMRELQKYNIYDIHLWNEWAFFGPSAYFSHIDERVEMPEDVHFLNMMVIDGLNDEELEIRERFFRRICEQHSGKDIGRTISKFMNGPPDYLAFGIPGLSRAQSEAMGLEELATRSGAFYFYNPLSKFPEIYDLWESTCRKYGYWNETYIPAWLSWADRNVMNPYPMIVAIPTEKPEIENFRKFWHEYNLELTKRGCSHYALGPSYPREAFENLGMGYQLLKKVKETLDPNNIMNPGVIF
jgi:FAD/FMN-containing dehydrogenase